MSDTFDHEAEAWDQLFELDRSHQLDGESIDELFGFPGKGPKTCQYCGRRGLHWKHFPELQHRYASGWKLLTPSGNLHICYPHIKFKGKLRNDREAH